MSDERSHSVAAAQPDVRAVFCGALDRKTPQELADFLDQACRGQPELRARVEALLRAHAEAGGFLHEPSSSADTPNDQIREGPSAFSGPHPETLLAPGSTRIRCPHCHNPIELHDEQPDEVLCPGCGSSFRVRECRETTTTGGTRPLGKFQLLERVGVGAFGAVWRARDTELDRIVALKIPHASLLGSPEDLERFQREARGAAQLRHPGIVTVHEVQTLEGLPTIVSDFIAGVPLRDLLEARRLTFRETATLVAEVADALDYAHGMGLVHRDMKPANIMVEFGGVVSGEEAAPPLTTHYSPLTSSPSPTPPRSWISAWCSASRRRSP
jgi:hypothetical protein